MAWHMAWCMSCCIAACGVTVCVMWRAAPFSFVKTFAISSEWHIVAASFRHCKLPHVTLDSCSTSRLVAKSNLPQSQGMPGCLDSSGGDDHHPVPFCSRKPLYCMALGLIVEMIEKQIKPVQAAPALAGRSGMARLKRQIELG